MTTPSLVIPDEFLVLEYVLKRILVIIATFLCIQFSVRSDTAVLSASEFGEVILSDPAFEALIASNTVIELLSKGHGWTEGPVWVASGDHLLFSQPRENQMYRWTPGSGTELFLDPSGLPDPDPDSFRAPGINGSFMSIHGTVISADQGRRAVTEINLDTGERTLLATHYRGKRLNGPNDLVVSESGAVYFTDPGSALVGGENSSLRELNFNGVYRRDTNGEVALISASIESPNGIALAPDGRTLYVSNAQSKNAVWMAFDLNEIGDSIGEPRVFYSLQKEVGAGLPGLPDGLAVDVKGNVFATGPGGVYVISPAGELLGFLNIGDKTSNCAFGGADGRTLFITSDGRLSRVQTSTTGVGL